jgi:hypothetical protein
MRANKSALLGEVREMFLKDELLIHCKAWESK